MKWIKSLFTKQCKHEWRPAEIHQVRVENGQLVPFKITTLQLLECKKCLKTKRIF